MFLKRCLALPYFIERLKYASFDFKALRAKTMVFCSVIPCGVVDANVSQEPAATIVMVEENEQFYTICPSCYTVLGCLTFRNLASYI